jgi:hypothetical protein
MSHDPIAQLAGPWRILVLDRDPADPKWLLATIVTPGDVQPALDGPGGCTPTLDGEVGEWLRGLLGHAVHLTPLHRAEAWRIDGRKPA